ncbi:hypothetical protein JKF63_04831 [Porcisia hertigi]|uniref:Phosphatidic acid phosphatase type 2/haloperoxidase domain-containing protein n=1 Tax=Porcisia hertigi TaxID=2761500 RepID=A0A836LDN1_9TRYP|nr:hypothetical protein JKF63_04831 [Porcisia hertigi]
MSLSHINYYIDKSCSFGVIGALELANLYMLQYFPGTVVVPFLTSCACIAAAASKGLKRVVKQPRPPGAPKVSPGMPSNHATSLSFLSLVVIYGMQRYAASTVTADHAKQTFFDISTPLSLTITYAWPLQTSAAVFSVYAAWLRVVRGHHTVAQVVAGYLLGVALAIVSLAVNYYGYTGSRLGGRVDDLPRSAKIAILLTSVVISAMVIRAIVRGSRKVRIDCTGTSAPRKGEKRGVMTGNGTQR